METDSNFDAVNVVIEKLSELVAQNNALQQDTVPGTRKVSVTATPELVTSGQKETIDTAKHLIEFVRSENPSLSFTRTPTKVTGVTPTQHVTRSVVKHALIKNERCDKTEEEIIVNLPANLGQLNLTNKKTLIESLMNLNASLQEKNDVSTVEKKGDKEAIYKCMKCDYCSHNKYYLKQHVELVHNAERPFKCPFCDYAGKRSHSLKEHLVVHSTNRPYECSLCNATFRKKGHLTNHIKMHANAKNFECNICEEKFGDRYLLYDHLRSTHSPDSFYACDFCEYATTIKSNIIMHMHTHGNPKSYKCDKCPFIALHINIMKEHAVGHGVGTTFHEEAVAKKTKPVILLKCSECGFTTDEKAILNDHMLKHINDINLLTSAKSQPKTPHDTSTMTSGTKDQPTAYVCKECDFMSTEAYAFITHMLSHKAKQGSQLAVTRIQTATADSSVSTTTTTTLARAGPEPPEPPQQWTHDLAVGVYRCTICGYFTKHQRTIKSHIWKHSGHKDIDYPMFQNGPLSVYDDVPIGKTTLVSNNNVIEMQKDKLADKGNKNNVEEKELQQMSVSKEDQMKAEYNGVQITDTSVEAPNTYVAGSTGNPKAVQISIPSLAQQHTVSSSVSSKAMATSVATSRVTRQSGRPCTAPVIQVVDKSQRSKKPVTVVLSKKSAEPKQVILLTTGSDKEGQSNEIRVPPKIHKMFPLQRSAFSEKAKEMLPDSAVQGRNFRQSAEAKQENRFAEAKVLPQQVQPKWNAASQTLFVAVQENQRETKEEEKLTNPEMTTDTSFDDADMEVSQGVPNESSSNIVKRRRELESSSNTEGEFPDSIAVPEKKICFDKPRTEENVVVEKLAPVFSSHPFALSESRGSSPRIPNSPRIAEIAAQSDSSNDSNPPTPEASTEVTIVETPVMDTVTDPSVHVVQSEYVVETQAEEEQPEEQTVEYEEIVYIEPGSEQVVEMTTTENVQSSTDEVVTLLSLLKKGPNYNPAYQPPDLPVQNEESPKRRTRTKSKTEGNNAPKKGISSHLLAVIEQLREKTGSISGEEEESPEEEPVEPPSKPSSRRSSAAGSKRGAGSKKVSSPEASVPIECYLYVETVEDDEGIKYRCKLCHYSSISASLMKTHMRLHKAKQPCECSLCEFVADSNESLQDHMLQHCKVRTYQCKLCPSIFNYKSQLRAHMRAHTFACERCNFETSNQKTLSSHTKSHSKDFYCDQCNEAFVSEEALANHSLICNSVSIGELWKCKHCDFETENSEQQQQHLLSHAKIYKCETCDYSTQSYVNIRNHCRDHEQEKTLKCELCDFIATSTRSLKSHMKRHANDQRFVQQPLEQYKCNLCGYVCHHLPSLKSHMWKHSSDTNYSYMITNDIINAAIDNPNLTDYTEASEKLQETAASGVAVPGIDVAQLSFQRADGSAGSLVTFRCCQCGFESSQKSQLNDHMKSHIDIIKKTFEVNRSQLLPGQLRPRVPEQAVEARSSKDSSSEGEDNTELRIVAPQSVAVN